MNKKILIDFVCVAVSAIIVWSVITTLEHCFGPIYKPQKSAPRISLPATSAKAPVTDPHGAQNPYVVAPIAPHIGEPEPQVPPGIAMLTADWCGVCKRFEEKSLPKLIEKLHGAGCDLQLYDVDTQAKDADKLRDPSRGDLPVFVAFRERVSELDPTNMFIEILGRLYGAHTPDEIARWAAEKAKQPSQADRADEVPSTEATCDKTPASPSRPGVLRRWRNR